MIIQNSILNFNILFLTCGVGSRGFFRRRGRGDWKKKQQFDEFPAEGKNQEKKVEKEDLEE